MEFGLVFASLAESATHGQNPVLTDDQVPELIRDPLQTRSQSCCRLKTTGAD